MPTRFLWMQRPWAGIFLTLTLLGFGVVHAKPGDLDPSFGVGGKQSTDLGGDDRVQAISLQPDGKTLVVGHIDYINTNRSRTLTLARYNADGSLDAGFGTGGKLITSPYRLDFMRSYRANSVAFQPDGKIILAGLVTPSGSDFFIDGDFALTRYNADGTLDTGFGSGGTLTTRFDVASEANAVALQPDGKIVAVGSSPLSPSLPEINFAVARYNSDGSLDTSFGSGGKLTTDIDGANDIPDNVSIQPDGKIVVAGIIVRLGTLAGPSLALARYNSDGTLDTSFGSGGKLSVLSDDTVVTGGAALFQPDGKIIVVSKHGLVRFRSDGSRDMDFGANGIASGPIGPLTLQKDGKILTGMRSARGPGIFNFKYDFAVGRYNSDGSLDTSFGEEGKLLTSFGDSSYASALALQPDGKIIAAGTSRATPDSPYDFALIRYLGDSGLPQPGWWWNSAQSGRGYTIEVQGDHLYFAGYLYDTSGRATWYTSGGPMTNNTSYTGTLYSFANGQTLTGNYKAPAPTVVGIINLQFTDATHGTLTWPGGTVPIERYVFGAGAASFQPENGWWWNESESGRGFTIEVQGNTLFMGGYMYDDSGNPVWYASSGNMNATRYQGQWLQYVNGQTLTGPYKFPDPPVSVGSVALEFTGRTNAMLTLPNGKQIALSRFRF